MTAPAERPDDESAAVQADAAWLLERFPPPPPTPAMIRRVTAVLRVHAEDVASRDDRGHP